MIATALWSFPIAGISSKDASVIFERHKETLKQLPGVEEVMMGSDGIWVYTEHPELLPEELEDLPIRAFPPIE